MILKRYPKDCYKYFGKEFEVEFKGFRIGLRERRFMTIEEIEKETEKAIKELKSKGYQF